MDSRFRGNDLLVVSIPMMSSFPRKRESRRKLDEERMVSSMGLDLPPGGFARLDRRGADARLRGERISGRRPSFTLRFGHALRHFSILGSSLRNPQLDSIEDFVQSIVGAGFIPALSRGTHKGCPYSQFAEERLPWKMELGTNGGCWPRRSFWAYWPMPCCERCLGD